MSWEHWEAAFEEVMVNGGELGNVGFILAQHRAEIEANRKECQCPMCGQWVNNGKHISNTTESVPDRSGSRSISQNDGSGHLRSGEAGPTEAHVRQPKVIIHSPGVG
jgi:hypothetical protein